MTGFVYNTGIPAGPNNPSADQPLMQTNTNSINSLIAVDHVGFNQTVFGNSNSGGWHTIIHQPAQSASPAPSSNQFTQLYCKSYTPNSSPAGSAGSQLFMTNNGGTIQMTGTALISNGGFAYCNGLIFQWGQVTFGVLETGSVTFQSVSSGNSIPFPSGCLNVQATLIGTSSSSQTIQITSKSATGFSWQFTTTPSATSYTGFYWLAIGN